MGNLGLIGNVPRQLGVIVQGGLARYVENCFFDIRAALKYRFRSGMLLTAGWRRLRLHLDDTRLAVNADLVFKDFFAGIGYHF